MKTNIYVLMNVERPLCLAVGRLSWPDEVASHFSSFTEEDVATSVYRLVVLKSWAMHSEELTKLHVIVLLLSVLIVETKYVFRDYPNGSRLPINL